MQFSVFWPCFGNASFCAPRILGSGSIEPDSAAKLLAFLSDEKLHRYELPPRPDISFHSPGGDLAGAVALGRLIRKLGLDTRLSPDYSRVIEGTGGNQEVFVKDVVCASACAFAFLGGVNRFLEKGSRYGIHQFSGTRGNIGDGPTQVTLVALAAYVEEMGVDRMLLDFASLVSPSEIYWLSPQDLQELRVDNMVADKARWKLDALEDGTVVATIVQTKPGTHAQISLTILNSADHPFLVVLFVPREIHQKSTQEAASILNGERVSLTIDGREVAIFKSVAWKAGQNGAVMAALPLTAEVVSALKRGIKLDFDASVPRAFAQYDPSLPFPLEGLQRLLLAVLK